MKKFVEVEIDWPLCNRTKIEQIGVDSWVYV